VPKGSETTQILEGTKTKLGTKFVEFPGTSNPRACVFYVGKFGRGTRRIDTDVPTGAQDKTTQLQPSETA
jgi:hypothetical protein